MSQILTFTPTDRILIVAPHPDDESIATGGLIQAARAGGAAVRVIVLTDGDANVWPQRWIEKRWRIDAAARARWGARRREEAREAMRVLGLPEGDAIFLGLPDLGLTDRLMRADAAVTARLQAVIAEFAPSCIVLPALADRHPDHSAAGILVRLALPGAGVGFPRLLEFAVHGGATDADASCELNDRQQQCKRAAILAHATQMRLSRKRFMRYAGAVEVFRMATADARANPLVPLRAHADENGLLRVELDSGQLQRGLALFVVLEGNAHACRLRVPWRSGSNELAVLGNNGGKAGVIAGVERAGRSIALMLQTGCADWRLGYVKMARAQPGIWVFDRFGWQVIMRS
ncbi:MAG: PIG-L family deacetylase [Xanthomonadaceae bacterium]|nr:PIG-L family deacetylase [Xanthomonadaceae bacterium]